MKSMPSSWLFLLAAIPVLAADAPSDRMTRIEHGLHPDVTIESDTQPVAAFAALGCA